MDDILVVPYDPEWPARYAEEAKRLRPLLPGRMEHFGSTAIPGLAAKPVIDILAEIPSLAQAPIEPLEAMGYSWWRANPNRSHLFLVKGLPPHGPRSHHLHLLEPDHPDWDRLLFRDYLRAHPEAAARYQALKFELAGRFRGDREAYTQAKTEFVRDTTRAAGSWLRARTAGRGPGPS